MKKQDNLLLFVEDSAFFLIQAILMLEYERYHATTQCPYIFEQFTEVNHFLSKKIDHLIKQNSHEVSKYALELVSDWHCKKHDEEILRFDLLQAFWWEYQNSNYGFFQQSTDYFKIPYKPLKSLFFTWIQDVFREFPEHVQSINILARQYNLRSINKLYSIEDYFVELYVSYYCIYERLFETPEEIYTIIKNINHLSPFKDLIQGGNDFQVLEKKPNDSDFLIGLQVPVRAQSNMIDVLHKVFLQMISMLLLNQKNNHHLEAQLQQAVDIATNLITLQKRNKYPLTQRKSPLRALEALLYQNFKNKHPTQSSTDFMEYLQNLFIDKGFKTTLEKSSNSSSDRMTPLNTNDLLLCIDIQSYPPLLNLKKIAQEYPPTPRQDTLLQYLKQHSTVEMNFGSIRKNTTNISNRFYEYLNPTSKTSDVEIYNPDPEIIGTTTVTLSALHSKDNDLDIEKMLQNIQGRRI
ncbi:MULTISPECIES: hypothetical protein [Acinetobacter]|jgi:hypothetical protein|uniref:hypothetical protein n=1 Tax=Acinetobacter TaxID=469 RepID=UPI0015D40024|nr:MULTISPECIES: hypothetical protein [Acinetobacter]WDE14949.1 hypothetical protein KMZ14_09190 [Acinetobacter schindleri]